MTRPTTRSFVRFQDTPDGLTAELNKPDLPYTLMELHKGHGPQLYRMYQIAVAIVLLLVVIGGMAVGLLARNYRRSTLIAGAVGTLVTIALILA